MMPMRFLAIVFWLALIPSVTQSADCRSCFCYPTPQSEETYKARSRTLEEIRRRSQIDFVTGLTNRIWQKPCPPEFAIFAKEAEAEKLLIVAIKSEAYNTLFRMRGLLETLTAVARVTPLLKEAALQEFFTFFDLCEMLGLSGTPSAMAVVLRIALFSSKKSFDV